MRSGTLSSHARKAPRTKAMPDIIAELAPIGPGAPPDLVEVEVGVLEVPLLVGPVADTGVVVDEVGYVPNLWAGHVSYEDLERGPRGLRTAVWLNLKWLREGEDVRAVLGVCETGTCV